MDSEQNNEITMNRWRDRLESMTNDELSNLFPCIWKQLDMTQENWIGSSKENKIKDILEVNYPEDDKGFEI